MLVVAVALATDAFAVSFATGMRMRHVSLVQTLRMAGFFGVFQFLMPVLGWLLGFKAQKYIEAYDHWLAFALLAFVGGKMLWETWENRNKGVDACELDRDPTAGGSIWLLAIATSLDALAVGLSLALLKFDIWIPAIIIGLVCFMLSAFGIHLGRLVCRIPGLGSLGNKATALGGLVLFAIGLKILHEHGVFS